MQRSRLYLVLAVIGFFVPPTLITLYAIDQGAFDIADMLDAMVANKIALAVFLDVSFTSLVLYIWSFQESRRLSLPNWWVILVATTLIGPCFGFPLFLYWRELAIERGGAPDSRAT